MRRTILLLAVSAAVLASHGAWAQATAPDAAAPAADATAPDASGPAPSPMAASVAAVVNDDVISTYDLRQRALLLIITSGVQPTQQNLGQIEREAVRSLVDEQLQLQEVRRIQKTQKNLHLEPTEKEIDAEVASLAKQNGLTPEKLARSFRSAGVDAQTLRDQLRAEMSWRRYMGGRFGSSIHISDNQINESLKRIEAARQKAQYQVSEIYIDAAKVGGEQAAQDGARQLIDQMKAGAPFAAVARQFSSLPNAANGGDAGWVDAADLPAAIEPVVEQMRPGQLSQPVPVQDGVYIVQLRDRRSGAAATMVSLKQVAVRLDPNAKPEQVAAAQATLAGLRGRIHDCASVEAESAKAGPGLVAGDLGEADLNDLRPEFRTAVEPLQVGQVSQPLRTQAGLHLLVVCGRRVGGAKAVSRDDIENRLYGEQLSMISKRFLRDLRNSATIESR